MSRFLTFAIFNASAILLLLTISCATQAPKTSYHDPVKAAFEEPEGRALPYTWFHVMSGNMSKEGLSKDLQSIADQGIGGVMLFNVSQGIPYGKVRFNSDEHIELIRHMAQESTRLGLDFGVHNCDGWTSSGGPWITPEHSMKKVVYSETVVEGGRPITVPLAEPPRLENFYREIAVLAYPAFDSDIADYRNLPTLSASDKSFDPSLVSDNDFNSLGNIKSIDEGEVWVQASYAKPFTLRSITTLVKDGRHNTFSLWRSDDGLDFEKVVDLKPRRPGKREWGLDSVLEPVTAKHFRLVSNKTLHIKELRFSAMQSIDNVFGRVAIARTSEGDMAPIGNVDEKHLVKLDSILDLSQDLHGNTLKTKLPKGSWKVIRLGYTSTGAVNIPASLEGEGLEVDKFDRKALKVHYDAFVGRVLKATKDIAPQSFNSLQIDSYEVGGQNWTAGYREHFKKFAGYDLTPYLLSYTGRFVGSAEKTEAALRDVRRLNSHLIVENYYKYFSELAKQDGLITYIEPYGFGPFNELEAGAQADIPMGEFWLKRDAMNMSGPASVAHIYGKNIVAAEAFTATPNINWRFTPAMAKVDGDRAWAFGANHFYFHRFTHQANTKVRPGLTMNRWGAHFDRTQVWWPHTGEGWFKYLARGQSLLQMGVSISDVLLYMGDGAPQSCPGKLSPRKHGVPDSINYDCLSREVLLENLSVRDKRLVLPHGAEYKVLYLRLGDSLSLESMQKINALAKAGATVIGDAPTRLDKFGPSAEESANFQSLLEATWSLPNVHDAKAVHGDTFPSEQSWQELLNQQGFNIDMSAQIYGGGEWQHLKAPLYYAHRRLPSSTEMEDATATDIYFFYNPLNKDSKYKIWFDLQGRVPERFDLVSGKSQGLGNFKVEGNRTQLILKMRAGESMFIVFRNSDDGLDPIWLEEPSALDRVQLFVGGNKRNYAEVTESGEYSLATQSGSKRLKVKGVPEPIILNDDWWVEFDQSYGFGETLQFDSLELWSNIEKVKYYSGSATYRKQFELPSNFVEDDIRLWLNLGDFNVSAKVSINGKNAGIAWLPNIPLDVSNLLKAGSNELQIEVANSWVNRLIGDSAFKDTSGYKHDKYQPTTFMPEWYVENKLPPASKRSTFTTASFFKPGDELEASGLLGPVKVYATKVIPLQ